MKDPSWLSYTSQHSSQSITKTKESARDAWTLATYRRNQGWKEVCEHQSDLEEHENDVLYGGR